MILLVISQHKQDNARVRQTYGFVRVSSQL
jgi:hypothetical protein